MLNTKGMMKAVSRVGKDYGPTGQKTLDSVNKRLKTHKGVHLNQMLDTDEVDLAKSVYPLDDIGKRIIDAAENGHLIITDKEKANNLLSPIGLQPSERSRVISLAKGTISQNAEKSNTQNENSKKSELDVSTDNHKAQQFDIIQKSNVADMSLNDVQKLRKQFLSVLDEAISNLENGVEVNGLTYSIDIDGNFEKKQANELTENDLKDLLERAYIKREFGNRTYIPLRATTPQFFRDIVYEYTKSDNYEGESIEINNLPMATQVGHLIQNMEEDDGSSYGNKRPHNLDSEDIIAVLKAMGNPSYIVLQKNGRFAEVVSINGKNNKKIVVSIDYATENNNYKYSDYMNGYNDGYYNIIVTQFEPDSLKDYLNQCEEIIYDKEKMNGSYQVGSGRVVTFTQDTPFNNNIPQNAEKSNTKKSLDVNHYMTAAENDDEETAQKYVDEAAMKWGAYSVITVDMSEENRAKVLKNTKISLTDDTVSSKDINVNDYNDIKSRIEKPLRAKLDKLGVFKKYKSNAIDIDFQFTHKGFNKSLHSQLEYGGDNIDFARVVANIEQLLNNAVLVETHTDKGKGTDKEKNTVEQYYVLLSALKNEGSIIPIQFEIEQYYDNDNRLYLAVAMTKINEADVVEIATTVKGVEQPLLSTSNISIVDIFKKINPKDKNFLKYIPDEFLNAEQKTAKASALDIEAENIIVDKNNKYGLGNFNDYELHIMRIIIIMKKAPLNMLIFKVMLLSMVILIR